MNWFYESAGQQQGPISEQEFDRLIAEGKITPETLVWREGLADWQPLRIARPATPAEPPAMPSGEVPPGHVRCSLTGKIIPESEAIYIQGKPYSAEAKPQVLHSLQAGGSLPSESDAMRNGPPWELRDEIGLGRGIWETITGVLTEPTALFGKMRRTGGLGQPLWFYFLLSVVTGIVSAIYSLFFNQFAAQLVAAQSNTPLNLHLTPLMNFIVTVASVIILTPVVAFVVNGIVHLCLMMFGGAKQPFETTFRVGCYSWGSVAVFNLLPGCGGLIGFVWGIVAMIIGLAAAQETTTGKATAAVLTPMVVCCGAFMVMVAAYGATQSS